MKPDQRHALWQLIADHADVMKAKLARGEELTKEDHYELTGLMAYLQPTEEEAYAYMRKMGDKIEEKFNRTRHR